MNAALHECLPEHPALWRGAGQSAPAPPGIPTGYPALDAVLPGAGWPVAALTELFPERDGIGELALLLPALARLSAEGRALALVAPPHLPYAPAFAAAGVELSRMIVVQPSAAQRPWAIRQAIGSHVFGMVLAWLDTADGATLRRLQLAAEGGSGAAVLLRPGRLARQASAAALKLRLEGRHGRLAVEVLKRRGARLAAPLLLDVSRPVACADAVVRDPPAQPAAAGIRARYA